jgi:hypothetical protein
MPDSLAETLLLRRDHVQRERPNHRPCAAGVRLRDVQIAAAMPDPRTVMRYDRTCKNIDRHPNYIVARFMTSGT